MTEILRTPDARFSNLPGYPFAPHYVTVDGLRIHYLDEGPPSAAPILMLHGEPSWSYLYRKVIPPLVAAGHRCIAPDLVGFGKSDKPANRADYTYARHVSWMRALIEQLELKGITLVCQDWGGLIGLRLVAELEGRFDRVVAANTYLPTGKEPFPAAFKAWRAFSQWSPLFPIGAIVKLGCRRPLDEGARAAYDAPFPSDQYKAGARQFPRLVPTTPDDPGAIDNQKAWEVLTHWHKPFLTAFGDRDPITRGADRWLQKQIPGCQGQPHTTIKGAGHFIQEDAGEELARVVATFIAATRNC